MWRVLGTCLGYPILEVLSFCLAPNEVLWCSLEVVFIASCVPAATPCDLLSSAKCNGRRCWELLIGNGVAQCFRMFQKLYIVFVYGLPCMYILVVNLVLTMNFGHSHFHTLMFIGFHFLQRKEWCHLKITATLVSWPILMQERPPQLSASSFTLGRTTRLVKFMKAQLPWTGWSRCSIFPHFISWFLQAVQRWRWIILAHWNPFQHLFKWPCHWGDGGRRTCGDEWFE